MIKLFRLSKQVGVFKKGFANLFSERASWRVGRLQNQMSSGHLVRIAVYGH
jgi:hypothetical protein